MEVQRGPECLETYRGENSEICQVSGCIEPVYNNSPFCETHLGDEL